MDKDKDFEYLKKQVDRLALRAPKRTTAIITPYPISACVEGENIQGPILRYMFPCEGTITKGMIYFGTKPRDEVKVTIHLIGPESGRSSEFLTNKQTLATAIELPVIAGDRLTIHLESPSPISEVWVSFLWTPSTKDVEIKSYLLKEILDEDNKETVPLSR